MLITYEFVAKTDTLTVSYGISLVVRQKSESQNGCFKKTKHVKFSEKRTFLTPDTHTYVRNVRFSENLTCFVSLKHPICDSTFSLITDDL